MKTDVKKVIAAEIADYQDKINTLKAALSVLRGAKESSTGAQEVTEVAVVRKKGEPRKARGKANGNNVRWDGLLIPFLKEQTEPLTVPQIVDGLFKGKYRSTKEKMSKRLQSVVWLYKKQGLLKSEGERGRGKGKANMKYSIA